MSTTSTAVEQQDIVFQQYKLAVEMATGLSARRQAANNFFIGLVSGFGALYSLLEKSGRSTKPAYGEPRPLNSANLFMHSVVVNDPFLQAYQHNQVGCDL
jgi:hypothetical protein